MAGSPNDIGVLEENKQQIEILDIYGQEKSSPRAPMREAAIDKEVDSLGEHEVFGRVPITSVPKGEKVIGSRYVFTQKANGNLKLAW